MGQRLPIASSSRPSWFERVGARAVGGFPVQIEMPLAIGAECDAAPVGRPYRVIVGRGIESKPRAQSSRNIVDPKSRLPLESFTETARLF